MKAHLYPLLALFFSLTFISPLFANGQVESRSDQIIMESIGDALTIPRVEEFLSAQIQKKGWRLDYKNTRVLFFLKYVNGQASAKLEITVDGKESDMRLRPSGIYELEATMSEQLNSNAELKDLFGTPKEKGVMEISCEYGVKDGVVMAYEGTIKKVDFAFESGKATMETRSIYMPSQSVNPKGTYELKEHDSTLENKRERTVARP